MTHPDPPSPTLRESTPSEPRGRRSRRLILPTMLLLLTAIGTLVFFLVSRSGNEGRPTTGSSPTNAPSPTPTPPPNPQASDDLNIAFRAINEKRTRAIVDRRPEMVNEIYLPDCACYELKSIIEEAIRRGEYHTGYEPTVLLVSPISGEVSGENLASVRVVTEQGPYSIQDDTGKVLSNEPGWAPQSAAWNLFRNYPGAPWKVGFLLIEGSADKILGPNWRNAVH